MQFNLVISDTNTFKKLIELIGELVGLFGGKDAASSTASNQEVLRCT